MLPPPYAWRPTASWIRPDDADGQTLPSAGASDLIGTLDELKRHVVVEHAESDDYLSTLHLSALQMVGDYTRWPMRTSGFLAECWFPWPRYGRWLQGRYQRPSDRPALVLPGPVDVSGDVLTRAYSDGAYDSGTAITGITLHRSTRLPHDAWFELPADFEYDSEDERLNLRYSVSWQSIYQPDSNANPLPNPWPAELAHTVYRVAATWYLYRESTMAMDKPVRAVVQATLGAYMPVEV